MRRDYFLIIVILFATFVLNGSGGENPIDGKVVDISTAIPGASQYLSQFYKEKWVYYTHFTYYDLDNRPRAYAIVFKKEGWPVQPFEIFEKESEKKGLEILRLYESINENSARLGERSSELRSQLRKEIVELKKEIRATDRYATVIAGAVDTLPEILKCYRGMPATFVNQVDAKYSMSKQQKRKQYRIDKVYFLGLPGIFYEVVPDIEPPPDSVSMDKDLRLFHLQTGKLVSITLIRNKFQGTEKETLAADYLMRTDIRKDSIKKSIELSQEKVEKEAENEIK